MLTVILLALIFLLPDIALACPKHVIHGYDLHLTSASDILIIMTALTALGLPVGVWTGKIARRFSSRRVAFFSAIAVTVAFALAGQRVWACHGYELVSPFLKQVHAEQMKYHELHGVYAESFVQLGLKPAPDQQSYFLPKETLPAKNPHLKEGLDLTQLPEGVSSMASADRFTVVAIGFTEPDRLDIWTMDEKETFREWSIPAFPKVETSTNVESAKPDYDTLTKLLNDFQGPLMLMSLMLGLSLGFAYSLRSTPRMTRPSF